jgi:uncharacterized protein
LSFSGKYNIQFKGLKEGFHFFHFEIDNRFFEFFANQDVEKGFLKVLVNLEKKSTLLALEVTMTGTVNVLCDRCLEYFDYPVNYQGELFVKFTLEQNDQGDPDVLFLDPNDYQIDLAQYFYESVILSLPYRKVHPDIKKNVPSCNPEMLSKLKKILVKNKNETDPRWDKLKEFRKE